MPHSMMKVYLNIVLSAFVVLSVVQETTSALQSYGESSTYGREFVLGFLPNFNGHPSTQLEIIVGSPADNVRIVVESADSVIFEGNISSSAPVSITIPSNLDILGIAASERLKGVRIASANDDPVFVLGANFIEDFNYGTFLAYPCLGETNAFDEVYEYRILSVNPDTFSLFLLAGCSNDTHVTITATQPITVPVDFQDPTSTFINLQEGEEYNVTLHQMNTLFIHAFQLDLSGSKIVSNKPLTVISGNDCAYVPQVSFDCEPIAVQIPPVSSWQTHFLISGYAGRMSDHLYFSLVSSEENTILEATCGPNTYTYAPIPLLLVLDSDEPYCYFDFDKPVFLTQLAYGGSIDSLGDPAIAIISGVDQYINQIEFVLLPTQDFPNSFISIAVPVEHYNPANITLDGIMVNCEWVAIYNRNRSIVGYGCNVTMPAHSNTMATQHTLSHSNPNGRISATVYGFRASPAQGYAYLSGQKLQITADTFATVNIESVPSPPNEGDAQGVAAMIRLTTSPTTATLATGVALSVSVMAGGSAMDGGTDFTLDTTTVNFAIGDGNNEMMGVMVTVNDDMLVEGVESYILSVSVSSGPATVGASPTVTVDITDNDAATVNIESVPSPPNEGNATGVAAMIRLTTSPTTATLATKVALSVSVMAGGSAVDGGTDFTLDTTTVNFAIGDGNNEMMDVMVTVNDDMLVEGVESYILSVSVCSGPATVGASLTVTLVIEDNDEENEQSLAFVPVTMFGNVKALPRREDSFSRRIIIPEPGMLYGDDRLTTAFVNENGVISFGSPWSFSHPALFPTNNFAIRSGGRALAPFWSDVDIRKSGNVWYATASEDDPQDQIEYQVLQSVNNYTNAMLSENDQFHAAWMLVAHWDHVHPSPHGANNHRGIPAEELEKTNNFQAVLVTNFSHTFAIYNYICGEMQWSGFGNEKASVGYIASREIFNNHPASGFSLIGDAISCPTEDIKNRRKRQIQEGAGTPVLQQIGIGSNDLQNMINFCVQGTPGDATLVRARVNPSLIAGLLEPCPPRHSLAQADVGRFIPFETIDNNECYITAKPLRITQPTLLSQFTFTQQCCYTAGDLEDDIVPMAGGLLLYHPIIDETNYNLHEQAFRMKCCTVANPDFCTRYFSRRPINDGSGYESPLLAVGVGDPHYLTFDRPRTYYHFQGRGTYSTCDVLNEDGNIVFSLQGRQGTGNCPPRGVTWHTGIAFGEPNVLTYQFGEPPSGFRVFRTTPDRVEITDQLQIGVPYYDDNLQSMLLKLNSRQLIAAFYSSGVVVRAYAQPYCGHVYMSVEALVPQMFKGRTQGLFGLLDGDPSNDLRLRNGQVLPPNVAGNVLYTMYDNSWRIDPEESMFFVKEDRKKRQETDDFVPVFFDQLAPSEEDTGFCQGNEQCLFDLIVTNDTEFAERTTNEQKEANETIDQFENISPNISGNSTFRVNSRQESTYTISVDDPGDNFTISIQGGLPPNSLLEDLGDGEYSFKWNLQELTNDPLVFVATDSRNASSTHTPTVEVCACANDGVCTVEGLLTTNLTITMVCICSEAFSGQFCEEDRNGCSEVECYEGVECLDVPAPGIGAVCGTCPPGFTGDGLKCYDIDECASNSSQCEDLCINTEGSYLCDCFEGYQVVGTTQCEDLDECTENLHECEQMCENTIGSYSCSCEPGFILNSDARNCTADQPCDSGGGCSHVCAVIDGVAQCFCPLGLQLSTPGGVLCVDVDECLNATCDQICVNTFGSFGCTCNDGYSLLSNGRSCEDIDECFEAALNAVDLCADDSNTQCSNSEGSFECMCAPGFVRENGTCQTIEEEPPPPPPVATPPSGLQSSVSFISPNLNISEFTPERQQQFREVTANAVFGSCINGSCSVLTTNEVMEQRFNLQVRPRNIAIPSGIVSQLESGELNITFYVQLDDGSILSVENLTTAVENNIEEYRHARFLPDIDECLTNNGGCEQVCIDVIGSFFCDCNNGYSLNANGSTCDDVDECSTKNGGCDQVCTNTLSSFNCSCNDGFSLNTDAITCDDVDECSTENGGCDQVCTNTLGSFNCSCNDGFSLNTDAITCDDVDECSTENGCCDQVCTNTLGSFNCSCNDGFTLNTDGITCDDVDECSTENGGCDQNCTNTLGSFNCSCNDGFSLNTDDITCDDVDECSTENGGCDQVCTNTRGSFNCSCNDGFTLNTDAITCDDVDECSIENGGCDQVCTNTLGSFNCSCNDGFSLNTDGITCDDVDECSIENGGCDQVCTNTPGSFNCSCNDGFSLNTDGIACDDVDECSTDSGGCDQVCTNALGSFNCSCNDGFSLNTDGITCDDVDECSTDSYGCDQVCTNTLGSFNCSCNDGFSLNTDGITCDDVEECSTENGGCDQNCTNTLGSFNCSCNDGFSLNTDGITCDDVDECSTENGGCDQVCTNTLGSFNCSCNDGFSLNTDALTCDDVDECSTENGGCDQVCTNTLGSFNCSCNDGFTLNTDGITCDDVDECSIENGGCDQVCTNTPGSFNCSCNDGFSVNTDGIACDDVDECSTDSGGCDQVCTNALGSFNCSCNDGFSLNTDGITCDDVDECSTDSYGCDQVCTNTLGSFNCSCNDGFSLNTDGITCDDVEECSTENGGCDQNCTNTLGSFNCSCNDGFSLNTDGITCDDVDECSTENGGCDQVCTNTLGSFNCSCNDGFSLNTDALTCDDVDECSTDNGGCDQVCTNTHGSFNCSCNDGFTLNTDGITCDDVDECSTENGGCDQVCTNTFGSFNCSCNHQGFIFSSDGKACEAVANFLPKIDKQAGLLISLDGYSVNAFTFEVQQNFRRTTALALNMYCAEKSPQKCQASTIFSRKRQTRIFTEEDIIIANIIETGGNSLQFELYVLLAEDLSVLPKDVVQRSVEENAELYQLAGFTSISAKFLVVNGLSTAQIIGIAFGSLAGVLMLIAGLGIGLIMSCKYYRRSKQYDVKQFKARDLDFVNPHFEDDDTPSVRLSFVTEEDTPSVHCVSITFKESEVGRVTNPAPAAEPEKEESV